MPDTTITVPPFILNKPAIKLGATGTSVDIACGSNQVTVEVDQDENTTETFCGTYTSYKPPVYTITVTALQSFGTGGLWTQLQPMFGTIQPFVLRPDSATAVGPTNPEMRGSAYVKHYPFLDAAVGETSEADLELGVQGIPTYSTTVVEFDEQTGEELEADEQAVDEGDTGDEVR